MKAYDKSGIKPTNDDIQQEAILDGGSIFIEGYAGIEGWWG